MEVVHTAIAIVLVVGLIIWAKVDPVISLVIACLYLGLAAGVGFEGTVTAITGGFGEIMTKVGLLIGFGVLIGALLHSLGTFRKLVRALLSVVGAKRLPYALTGAMSTVFPSIYVDVQVVLAAPIARSSARHVGPRGLAHLAGAIGTGIFAGYVFVVPGLAAVTIAGILEIPLGTYMIAGIVLGPATALLTTFLFGRLLRLGWWKPETDEAQDEPLDGDGVEQNTAGTGPGEGASRSDVDVPLPVALLPILVPLLMIAGGAFADLADVTNGFVAFLGNPNVALFVGLLGAYLLARAATGVERTDKALKTGFHTTGEILLITGIGGSLGAVIEATGLDQTLASLFSASEGAAVVTSILLAWFIAAVLHLAIGSVSVAAIAAAGIISPVLGSIDVAPLAIGLAVASGSMFALTVNSNFFWMFKSLLGLTTKGALKTMTLVTSMASLVSLPMVLAVAFLA
ncbi:GntP family gluconate:H+ symporter [Aeromicrobium sp. SORGH_AS981]|uniref:GntP family permease n=1 Tax=Aeromicrobium sp. SORGH_AS_0981 TaxID=3041802 RepID=UPI0028580585|nr:SLC13 family permease [Aeromicrobium sp. SORGH_AS_0981]MDR6118130.1 GntP family gluconate:H+ symporter [Aeromicrobium sp. SORGH_AS_0981]